MTYKLCLLLFLLHLLLPGSSSSQNKTVLFLPDDAVCNENTTILIVEDGATCSIPVLVYENFNLTAVASETGAGAVASEKLCWESNSRYVTEQPSSSSQCWSGEKAFSFSSSLIGIFEIKFYRISPEHGGKVYLDGGLEVVVGREKVAQTQFATIAMAVGLGFALLIMGMDIDTEIVLQVIKRPVGPVVGFFAQFLIMPSLSYLLGYLLLQTNFERLGLLLLGCSPGGVGSNFWTALLKGDINLSVTMTFFSSLASFAMTSLWIYLLGRPLASKHLPIPFGRLAVSLISFVVPLLLGIWIKRSKPEWAEKITKKGKPIWVTMVAIMVVVAIYINFYFFFLVSWRHLVAGACLGLLGYTLGGGSALLARMEKPQVIAVAIETAIQNGSIAFVVINLTFPSPYSDMAVMPILAHFFCAAGPMLFVLFLLLELYNKIRAKFKNEDRSSVEFSPVSKEDNIVKHHPYGRPT